jgi:L,D-peptidoglycan transpeptidase YkuD (ErfK/YbiS/YcfS/YnhG family)
MPYRQALDGDVWVDDLDSPDYNRWVKKDLTKAASFELMRRKDDRYKYGLVVEYNTRPVVKGNGSAIFIHVWKNEDTATSGCVAMAEADILRLLAWLDPAKKPAVILGQAQDLAPVKP